MNRTATLLLLLLIAVPAFAQDTYEPNESFFTASALPLDTDLEATIHVSNDDDYYSVAVAQSGVLFVRLTSVPGGLALRIQIYNSSQQLVASVVGNQGTIFQAPANVGPGSYFVLIERFNGSATNEPYRFRVELDRNDPFEPNGSFSAAAEAPLDQDLTGILAPSDDDDYLRVQTPGRGVLLVRLTEVPGPYAIRTQIYDSQQQLQTSSAGNQGTIFVTPVQTSGDLHYVLLERFNGSSVREPYRFRLEYDPTDRFERNGSFSEAATVSGNETHTAQILPNGDDDYYTFTVSSVGDVSVRLLTVPSGLTLRVQLYDEGQSRIRSWTTSGPSTETFSLQPGRYFVATDRFNGSGSETPYTFRIDGTTVATPDEDGPETAARGLSAASPNPTRGATTLTYTTDRTEALTVAVYDALGRRVAVLHDGVAQPGAPLALRLDTSRLTPGVYVVRTEGTDAVAPQRVVVVR